MQKWLENSEEIPRLKQLNSTFLIDVLSNIKQMSPGNSFTDLNGAATKTMPVLSSHKDHSPKNPTVVERSKSPSIGKAVTVIAPRKDVPVAMKEPVEDVFDVCSSSKTNCPPQAPILSLSSAIKSSAIPILPTVQTKSLNRSQKVSEQIEQVNKTFSLPVSTSMNVRSSKGAFSLFLKNTFHFIGLNSGQFSARRAITLTNDVFECYSLFGIDTFRLTEQAKVLMSTHSIGQKVLGENVLGLCQASVCDLLNKPRPWTVLHRRVKEAYIRLQIWVNNPKSFETERSEVCSPRMHPSSRSPSQISINGKVAASLLMLPRV